MALIVDGTNLTDGSLTSDDRLTRVTVVDKDRGIIIEKRHQHVEVRVQDEGRTLKVFLRARDLEGC